MERNAFLRKLLITLCVIIFIMPTFCLRYYYFNLDPKHKTIEFLLNNRLTSDPYPTIAMWEINRIEDESGNYVIYHKIHRGSVDGGKWLRDYIGPELTSYHTTYWRDYVLDCKWYYPIDPADWDRYLIRQGNEGGLSLWEAHYIP